jgi:hypothetical protein
VEAWKHKVKYITLHQFSVWRNGQLWYTYRTL